jgi:L-serine dehydratase
MHVDMSTPLPLDRGLRRPISVAELLTIGIGRSSSHTVGPMRAAFDFAQRAVGRAGEGAPVRVTCDLYGSLALTGRGHATDTAAILGLAGWEPERLDPDAAPGILAAIAGEGRMPLAGTHAIAFAAHDIVFHPCDFLPEHPSGMTLTAMLADGARMRKPISRSAGARSCARARPHRQATSRCATRSVRVPNCLTSAR